MTNTDRIEFEMTEEQHAEILRACKPMPYMVVGGVPPRNPCENVERAWAKLGQDLGFKTVTVRSVPGKSDYFFTAEPFARRGD